MPLTLFTLFVTFLKAGGLTIGDGYATIQPLKREIVDKNGWLSEADFTNHLTVAQSMPGIFNINLAAYLGQKLKGRYGCLSALLGMLLPPMVILVIFATFFNDLRGMKMVESFMRGARPAIVALILLPVFKMWRQCNISLSTVWIPVGTAISVGLLGFSPTYIILGFCFLGLLYAILVKNKE